MKIPGAFLLGIAAVLALVFSLTLLFGTFWLSQMRNGTDVPAGLLQQIVPAGASAQVKENRLLDFQAGTVVHLKASNFLFLTPVFLWGLVFFFDRGALGTRGGRTASRVILLSLVVAFGALFWLRHWVVQG